MIPEDFQIITEVLASGEVDGIVWVAARAPLYNAVNGYIRVPDNHPWKGNEDYEGLDTAVPWGHFTYMRGNWLGFDTLHAGQWWPAEADAFKRGPFPDDRVMTEELVIEWTQQRAREASQVVDGGTYVI